MRSLAFHRTFWILLIAILVFSPTEARSHAEHAPICLSEPPPPNIGPPETDGFWEPVVDLGVQGIHAIHLPLSGKIALWGYNSGGAILYNPETGAIEPTEPPLGLFCSGHAHLPDGKILVAGGQGRGSAKSSVFDPFSETWEEPVPLNAGRYYPTLTSLPDGRVFTASGTGGRSKTPEIYDPTTGEWTRVGCETTSSGRLRCRKSNVRLHWYPRIAPGLHGGLIATPASRDAWVYTFDPLTELWTEHEIGDRRRGKVQHGPGVYYAPGKMLVSGSDSYAGKKVSSNRAVVYEFTDFANPTVRDVEPMHFERNRNNMTLLADGTILATGGDRKAPCRQTDPHVYHAELWDPNTETWEILGAMQNHRVYHSTAILLRDGSVLSAGGERKQKTSQIYRPPYLYKGPRPTISSVPAELFYGSVFQISTPEAANISQVNLIKLGAVTHAYDMSQRISRLSFTPGAGTLSVNAPFAGYEAPPGYYLLFLISDQGVPSIGEYVRVR